MTAPPVKPDRAAREAAALRQNLLKRKDQARRREQARPAEHESCNDSPAPGTAAATDTDSQRP